MSERELPVVSDKAHCVVEHCWVLLGKADGFLFTGRKRKKTSGDPASVAFAAEWVMSREETKGDVVGFYHTHPSFPAVPSQRDHETMKAWVTCFGKPLLAVIRGVDGLRGWWYYDDEEPPDECVEVRDLGMYIVAALIFPDDEAILDAKDTAEDERLIRKQEFEDIEEL